MGAHHPLTLAPATVQTDEEVIAGWVRNRYPDYRSLPERVSANRTRAAVLSGVASVVVFAALQFLRPAAGARHRPWATGQARWLTTAATGLVTLGALVVVAGYVYALTSHRARAERRSALLALTVRQRRQVRRQALGLQPCRPEDVALLRLLARRWSRPDSLTGLAVGATLLFSGLAILCAPPLRVLAALLVAYSAVAVVVLLRRAPLARRFLTRRPPLAQAAP